jgi:hypothetical protein
LATLSLSENEAVAKWEPLSSLKALKTLNLFKTGFKDLRLLRGLPQLSTLSMQKCALEHPEALLDLPELRMLYINGATGINDLAIFTKAPKLQILFVGHDPKQFPPEQVDAFKAAQKAAIEAAKKTK